MPSATSFIEAFTKTVLFVHFDIMHYWQAPFSKTVKTTELLFLLENTRGPLKSDLCPDRTALEHSGDLKCPENHPE